MKNTMITFFLANLVSFVYASENLQFVLDHTYRITAYNNHNMKFYTTPDAFIGKDVFEIVPLNIKDKTMMVQALQEAANHNTNTSSHYILDNKSFQAFIQPMKTIQNDSERNVFIVKVMESQAR